MSSSRSIGRIIMNTIRIRPIEVIGNCPAGLTTKDEFEIVGMRLENRKGSTLCFLGVSQFPIGQGIWQLQSNERFFSRVSCPGCTFRADQENRVVFLLGHADKWQLCKLISEYLALCHNHPEPAAARKTKEDAILLQNQGKYAEAAQKMEKALYALKSTLV